MALKTVSTTARRVHSRSAGFTLPWLIAGAMRRGKAVLSNANSCGFDFRYIESANANPAFLVGNAG